MTDGVGQLKASLAQARDSQVARVVAMVDALPERGAADALIAPLRPRLAQLRPVRPPGFVRLLFTPLNPIITSTAEWRRCGVGVPRSALAPLGWAVRAARPEDAGGGCDDDAHLTTGFALWPGAAAALARIDVPGEWSEASGLTAAEFTPVVSIVVAVLAEAQAIEMLARQHGPVGDEQVWAILARSKARGAAELDSVVSVMLARLAMPARVANLATRVTGNDGVTGRAIDRLAASLRQDAADPADFREAAREAGRVAAMLDALDEGATPERRARLDQIRRDADSVSRHSFSRAVGQTLTMAQAAMTASFDDGAIAAIEACARDLRRLETAARKLGSGEYYDGQLADAAAVVHRLDGDLGLADRVRLIEILAGPQAATAVLTEGRKPAVAGE